MVDYLCSEGLELDHNFQQDSAPPRAPDVVVKYTIASVPNFFVGILDEVMVKERSVYVRSLCLFDDAAAMLTAHSARELKVHELTLTMGDKAISLLPFDREGHKLLSLDFACEQNNASLTLKVKRSHN